MARIRLDEANVPRWGLPLLRKGEDFPAIVVSPF